MPGEGRGTTAGQADGPGDEGRGEKAPTPDTRADAKEQDIPLLDFASLPPTRRLEVVRDGVLRFPDPRRPDVKDREGARIAEEKIGPRKPDRVQPTGPADKVAAAVEQIRQGASYLETAGSLPGVTPAQLAKTVLEDMRRRGEPVTAKARYPDSFKAEVVKLVREGGEQSPDKLAARLGLGPTTPWKWESQARAAEE